MLLCLATSRPQRAFDRFPSTVVLPLLKVPVDRAPVWKLARQHPPRTLTPLPVSNGVDHTAHRRCPVGADRSAVRNARANSLPLAVRQIGGIVRRASVHLQLTRLLSGRVRIAAVFAKNTGIQPRNLVWLVVFVIHKCRCHHRATSVPEGSCFLTSGRWTWSYRPNG